MNAPRVRASDSNAHISMRVERALATPRVMSPSEDEYFAQIARALDANAALPPCAKVARLASQGKKRSKIQVAVTSDLHCDMRPNAEAMEEYARREMLSCANDTECVRVLVVAGDVGTSLASIERALRGLRQSVDVLCYLPAGNHELWTSNTEPWATKDEDIANRTRSEAWYACDSIGKMIRLMDLCTTLDVRCSPVVVGDVIIRPIYGWYSDDFDLCEREYTMHEARFDAAARWPSWIDRENPRNSHAKGIGVFMSRVNEYLLRRSTLDVEASEVNASVTYSHFIPRLELYRGTPTLLKVMGSRVIDDDLRRARRSTPSATSHVHVFGHSHLNVDTHVDGVRYVQCALGYPHERWFGINYPKIVHVSA